MEVLRALLPLKYAPLTPTGNGLQSVYLTELPPDLASALIALAQVDPSAILTAAFRGNEDPEFEQLAPPDTRGLEPKAVKGALEKYQIVLARRGQGVFKHNVRLREQSCRITGVTNHRHLRASHIKPWSKSEPNEKIDGANGLLLSPHVDHLFDRGFISFKKTGEIITSPVLELSVLQQWSLNKAFDASPFSADQDRYLEYHRDVELLQGA